MICTSEAGAFQPSAVPLCAASRSKVASTSKFQATRAIAFAYTLSSLSEASACSPLTRHFSRLSATRPSRSAPVARSTSVHAHRSGDRQ